MMRRLHSVLWAPWPAALRASWRPPKLRLLLALLLLLTAASLAWSEGHPAWGENSWWVLWALGLASLVTGVLLLRLAPARPGVRLSLALLVAAMLALGQMRSLELLLMLGAWSLSGFAP